MNEQMFTVWTPGEEYWAGLRDIAATIIDLMIFGELEARI